jgi:hypothetical protein
MRPADVRAGVELTDDRWFAHRVRRLVVVSAAALGIITLLAVRSDGPTWSVVLLVGGWALMPVILATSLRNPQVRFGLVLPASLVTVGLLGMLVSATGAELLGWAVMAAGILLGGTLGMWFWYRWVPVPARFNDPYGPARMTLVAIHIALVLIGAAIVFSAT